MKKDWNYIASVEKAIAEKYGKISSQDFRADWEPSKEDDYLKQLQHARRQKEKKDSKLETYESGDISITRRRSKTKTKRTCPVCKTYSFSRRDDLYMNRFECCEHCYIVFVVNREERWQEGWRPDADLVKDSLRSKK